MVDRDKVQAEALKRTVGINIIELKILLNNSVFIKVSQNFFLSF